MFELFWIDERLKWNLNYFNITGITINLNNLWYPKQRVHAMVTNVITNMDDLTAEINSNGRVRGNNKKK